MITTSTMIRRPRVFVSFCGSDTQFAEKLIDGLRTDGRFEVSFNRDITDNEDDSKTQVGDLIADADTVVFVVSPDALKTCKWELECARENAKRIIPVAYRPNDRPKAPFSLNDVKVVDFANARSFSRGLIALLGELTSDIDWLREHTRLLGLARKWEHAGRPNHLLLTGADIRAAKMWTLGRPDHVTKPNDLHMSFISTSEAVQIAQTSAVKAYEAELDEAEAVAYLGARPAGLSRWKSSAFVGIACLLIAFIALSGGQPLDAKIERLAEQQQIAAVQADPNPDGTPDKAASKPGKNDLGRDGQSGSGFSFSELGDALMWRVLPKIDRWFNGS